MPTDTDANADTERARESVSAICVQLRRAGCTFAAIRTALEAQIESIDATQRRRGRPPGHVSAFRKAS